MLVYHQALRIFQISGNHQAVRSLLDHRFPRSSRRLRALQAVCLFNLFIFSGCIPAHRPLIPPPPPAETTAAEKEPEVPDNKMIESRQKVLIGLRINVEQ